MKFPKLLDGPNPVGEAKARHLETIDAPFLTAIGPGFVASKKGEFYEVTGAQESHQVVEDGWYSFSEPEVNDVVVRGSPDPNTGFRQRGIFGNPLASGSLFASGSGWGYIRDVTAIDDPSPGYVSYKLLRSRSGRKGSELISSYYLASTVEGLMGYGIYAGAATSEASYDSGHQVVSFEAEKKTDVDGVVRQIGVVKVFFETSPGVWSETVLPSPIAADTESYTIASGCVLAPDTILVSIAKFGDILPQMYITSDLGASWTTCPALPDIFPDQGVGWAAFKTRAQLAIDFPLETAQQIEMRFVLQTTVKMRAYGTELKIQAIAADRILIDTSYLQANAGNIKWQSLSLIDPYTGDLKWQKHSELGALVVGVPLKFYDAKPSGFGAWVYILANENGYDLDEAKVVTEFGNVETDIPIPVGFVSFDAPFYHRKETNEINLDPPALYFMASDGVTSYLALTKDYFTTAQVTAKVGDFIDSSADFSEVIWVGTRAKPAPIDPTFPWRTDNRVSMPDWWINVSAYGG